MKVVVACHSLTDWQIMLIKITHMVLNFFFLSHILLNGHYVPVYLRLKKKKKRKKETELALEMYSLSSISDYNI